MVNNMKDTLKDLLDILNKSIKVESKLLENMFFGIDNKYFFYNLLFSKSYYEVRSKDKNIPYKDRKFYSDEFIFCLKKSLCLSYYEGKEPDEKVKHKFNMCLTDTNMDYFKSDSIKITQLETYYKCAPNDDESNKFNTLSGKREIPEMWMKFYDYGFCDGEDWVKVVVDYYRRIGCIAWILQFYAWYIADNSVERNDKPNNTYMHAGYIEYFSLGQESLENISDAIRDKKYYRKITSFYDLAYVIVNCAIIIARRGKGRAAINFKRIDKIKKSSYRNKIINRYEESELYRSKIEIYDLNSIERFIMLCKNADSNIYAALELADIFWVGRKYDIRGKEFLIPKNIDIALKYYYKCFCKNYILPDASRKVSLIIEDMMIKKDSKTLDRVEEYLATSSNNAADIDRSALFWYQKGILLSGVNNKCSDYYHDMMEIFSKFISYSYEAFKKGWIYSGYNLYRFLESDRYRTICKENGVQDFPVVIDKEINVDFIVKRIADSESIWEKCLQNEEEHKANRISRNEFDDISKINKRKENINIYEEKVFYQDNVEIYDVNSWYRFVLIHKYANTNIFAACELANVYYSGREYTKDGKDYMIWKDKKVALGYYFRCFANNYVLPEAAWSVSLILDNMVTEKNGKTLDEVKEYLDLCGDYAPALNQVAMNYLKKVDKLLDSGDEKNIMLEYYMGQFIEYAHKAYENGWIYAGNNLYVILKKDRYKDICVGISDIKEKGIDTERILKENADLEVPWSMKEYAKIMIRKSSSTEEVNKKGYLTEAKNLLEYGHGLNDALMQYYLAEYFYKDTDDEYEKYYYKELLELSAENCELAKQRIKELY